MITGRTCRAGRALIDMSQGELARRARVGLSTVRGLETGRSKPVQNNLQAIENALVSVGIMFIAEDDVAGEGVRLKSGEQPA